MSPTKSTDDADEEHGERFRRLLMKTEVYLSYNLYNQATRAIDELLQIDPDHVEGHERRLQVQEATGERSDAAKTLVRLAWLSVDEPLTANKYLKRARKYVDDDEVRSLAAEHGLELNQVLRVSDGTFVEADPPDQWPFRDEDVEHFERRWLYRRLTKPVELYLLRSDSDEPEELFSRSLANASLEFPVESEQTAMLFIEDEKTYAVFRKGEFMAVHELAAHATALVVGKIRQQDDWDMDAI